jgi:hypothetical protein
MAQKQPILTRILAVSLLALSSLTGLQAQESRWSIALTGGAAIPVGKFAGQHISDSTTSFAKPGPALNLLVHYHLSGHFGVALLLTGQLNTPDNQSMIRQYSNAEPGSEFSVSAGTWQIGKIVAGPTYSVPFARNKSLHLTARLMAGALKTSMPKMTIAEITNYGSGGGLGGGTTSVGSESMQAKTSMSWAFAYLAGAGLRYTINRRFSLRGDLDYAYSMTKAPLGGPRQSFRSGLPVGGVIYGGTLPPGTTPVTTGNPNARSTYSLPIASLNLSAGLQMRL